MSKERLKYLQDLKDVMISTRDQVLESISTTEHLIRMKAMINELLIVLAKDGPPKKDNYILMKSLSITASLASEINIEKEIQELLGEEET